MTVITTSIKKVSELEGNFVEVYVMDYIARKRYFESKEIAGWLLEEKDGATDIYHLYRRADNELGESVNEPLVFAGEKFEGKEKDKQMLIMEREVKLQHYSRENDEILAKVKPFIS